MFRNGLAPRQAAAAAPNEAGFFSRSQPRRLRCAAGTSRRYPSASAGSRFADVPSNCCGYAGTATRPTGLVLLGAAAAAARAGHRPTASQPRELHHLIPSAVLRDPHDYTAAAPISPPPAAPSSSSPRPRRSVALQQSSLGPRPLLRSSGSVAAEGNIAHNTGRWPLPTSTSAGSGRSGPSGDQGTSDQDHSTTPSEDAGQGPAAPSAPAPDRSGAGSTAASGTGAGSTVASGTSGGSNNAAAATGGGGGGGGGSSGSVRGKSLGTHVALSAVGAFAGVAAILATLARSVAAVGSLAGTAAVAAGALGGAVVGEVLLGGAKSEDLETDRDVERAMDEAADRVVQRLRALKAEGGLHTAIATHRHSEAEASEPVAGASTTTSTNSTSRSNDPSTTSPAAPWPAKQPTQPSSESRGQP